MAGCGIWLRHEKVQIHRGAVRCQEQRDSTLKIAIVDESAVRAAILEDGLREAGFTHVERIAETHSLLARIYAMDPDVILIDLENPSRDMLEQMFQMSRAVKRPVAMFVDQSDSASIQASVDAGVSAYIVDGLKKERITSILDLCISRFNAFSRLQGELGPGQKRFGGTQGYRPRQRRADEGQAQRRRCLRAVAQDGHERKQEDCRNCAISAHSGGAVQMSESKLRIGYIPLVDATALLVAADMGFAKEQGVDIELVREVSWSNVRDKLNIGLFDAAHLLSPVAVASTLGLGHVRVPLVAPFNLGLNGNAITVSPRLFASLSSAADGDITDPLVSARALARVVAERKARGSEPLNFGMTFPFSNHNYQLCFWMAAGGVDPNEDVRLVVLPPPYMVESLASGHVDGFCVGAPWNSVAVDSGIGRILHFGCDIVARATEKCSLCAKLGRGESGDACGVGAGWRRRAILRGLE